MGAIGAPMRHDWILDVLSDLRNYALRNGLAQLATQVDAALRVARAEIAAADRDPGNEDGEGNGDGGGAPPGGWTN